MGNLTNTDNPEHRITYRDITIDDMAFLMEVYKNTREEEMSLVPHWSEAEKSAFISHQFHAQHTYYQARYPEGKYQVILFDGTPSGRIYLNRNENDIRIIDISILPSFRNQGIGESIMRRILQEAAMDQRTVSISVERFNRAQNLYTRLGFKIIDESHPIYLQMKWGNEM